MNPSAEPRPAACPVDEVLPELCRVLAAAPAAVLEAPPGAGKTTRVPLALLDQPWLAGRKILLLEPRRLAASNAAGYMARLLGERVGERVGFAIRFHREVSARTRLEVVTEGILTRRLQADPLLEDVGLVIFDEFHERHLISDLGLALCRDVQLGLRPDLKLLVMSATLEGERIAALLGEAPRVTSRGRSFPVDIRYLPTDPQGAIAECVARGVRRALAEESGDVLAFLPGQGEIRSCAGLLADIGGEVELCPLYGNLPFEQQERAIRPGPRRRVVLATNLAETSLTIEGIRVVVDGGHARQPRFDPAAGLGRLVTVRISRASAEQRAGRAGRLGPGVCYRLWTEGTQGSLLPFTQPEIRQADLAGTALELARWGVPDGAGLAWLDPPPAGALAAARELLQLFGALDARGQLTAVGRAMAELPAHPRLARLLLAAEAGHQALAADLVALLEAGAPRPENGMTPSSGDCDLLEPLRALRERMACGGENDPTVRTARYWRRRLNGRETGPLAGSAVGPLLAAAFPDRLARQRPGERERYQLRSGQGARLAPSSCLAGQTWLVASELAGGQGEALIRQGSALSESLVRELFGSALEVRREVAWDEGEGRVVAREVERIGALVLTARPVPAEPGELNEALLEGVRRLGLDGLSWAPEARQLAARVELLRRMEGEAWPDFSPEGLDAELPEWLAPYLDGCRSRADLKRLELLPALENRLGWELRRRLDRQAPTHLEVPSGSRIRLDYAAGTAPVLAVKLQELFGLAASPRVCAGRVAVLCHLLSPAGRPIQVTSDLASFWRDAYQEVRKELKGRYPKHPWPEDPWQAEPTRRTKPRRS